ncbi:MAG TPA: 2-oxoglutarate dehydrogenase E1 component [Salinivirgaceae bacterium]|nr:2-oxoglutarate dehydrogenase E1 component [Salinivirgaceae bacterium]
MPYQTFLSNFSLSAFDEYYQEYKTNPQNLSKEWLAFFEGFELAQNSDLDKSEFDSEEFKVINLIEAYRERGHLFTKTNPVRERRKYLPTLDLHNFGISEDALQKSFRAASLLGLPPSPLATIIDHLNQTYCQSVGVEYKHIQHVEMVQWIQKRLETSLGKRSFSPEERRHILFHVLSAVSFEKFIIQKFPGQKSFSLEGGESLIPAMDRILEYGADKGLQQVVVGMAHRGRLNVLANILQKPYRDIFAEFAATGYHQSVNAGDVKYHLGYQNRKKLDNGNTIEITLLPNPSHLETVTPVTIGVSRAIIEHRFHGEFDSVLPIVIHGDAAIAGQGVVYETIQMAGLEGYTVGGTIHVVINNQVGFTTNYTEGRTSTYSTDVAKVTQCPVIHVNADDVEAVIFAVELAVEFRQKWHRDVFIDLLGYRRHGHNEGDEPRFTQPRLYKLIEQHPNVGEIYSQKLLEDKVVDSAFVQNLQHQIRQTLEIEFNQSTKKKEITIHPFGKELWDEFVFPDEHSLHQQPDTSYPAERLIELAIQANSVPVNYDPFKKVLKILDDRKALIRSGKVDWALAEQLAIATLLDEHHPVRISGQDSIRGTFSRRHAAIYDQTAEQRIFPLRDFLGFNHFQIYNSPLSEYAVLGFEYGYAMFSPQALTIWEAQFGDFSNNAQVIIDNYIVSASEKWGVMNGLTMMLPHGYEGQGAEHSSARIERFLALTSDDNISVCNVTTPANLFHLLRRQLKRNFRLPLILFTPKSLLRHPKMISDLQEFSSGTFQPVIDDQQVNVEAVSRVVFCSGKIAYDLFQEKERLQATDVAIIRIEELFPFPGNEIQLLIEKYSKALVWLWVQEEPENMGAWEYMRNLIPIPQLQMVARRRRATTAVGLQAIHKLEQEEIVRKVFKPCTCERKLGYCGLQCITGKQRIKILKQREYLQKLTLENL